MEYFYIVMLRLLHIGGGVFWAGADIYMAAFLIPAVAAAGPAGDQVMQTLSRTNRMTLVLDIMSAVTLVSGFLLIHRMSSGFQAEWMTSRYGLSLMAGGLAAVIAFTIGHTVNSPTGARLARLAMEIEKAGGPPSPQQLGELGALKGRLTKALNVIAVLMVVSIASMSVARYL